MRTTRRTNHATPARGFTLIEILVVVSIIAVLLTIGVAAGIKMAGSNRLNSTKLLLSKLQAVETQYELLTKQKVNHSKVITRPFLWEGSGAVMAVSTAWSLFPGDTGTPDTAPAAVKLDQDDAADTDESDDVEPARVAGIERWVWVMSQVPETRQMIDALGKTYLKDTDGNGFLEVVDGWEHPLVYAAYVYHGTGADTVPMDQFLPEVGGPFSNGTQAVSTPGKWRPFFASAGPDGYWGDVGYTPPPSRDTNQNGTDDRTEDNLFSFDFEGGQK